PVEMAVETGAAGIGGEARVLAHMVVMAGQVDPGGGHDHGGGVPVDGLLPDRRARRLPGVPREVPDDVAAAAAGSDEDRLAVDPGGHAEDGPGGHRLPGGEGPAVGVQGDQPAVVLVVVGGVTGGLAEVEEVAPHHE